MRRSHLAAFQPVCPRCRQADGVEHGLVLSRVLEEDEEHVIHGLLGCPNPECRREYPILDGIPILIVPLRAYARANATALLARSDLPAQLESLVGDALGPDSQFERNRQVLNAYARDHWGSADPEGEGEPLPGQAERLLEAGLARAGETSGPVVDLGCAAGGTTFALARHVEGAVLGLDLNLELVRLAMRVLRTGEVRYPRRVSGLVYDQRRFSVRLPDAERVDFWVADATALPLPSRRTGLVSAINLLDSIHSPRDLLAEMQRLLPIGGAAVLSSPFDWSSTATKPEQWLGGHSQRNPGGGDSRVALERTLRAMALQRMDGPLVIESEEDELPWSLRTHDRQQTRYRCWLGVLRKQ